MFCKNCGTQLEEGAVFCPNCGTNNSEESTEAQVLASTNEEGGNKILTTIKELGAVKIGVGVVAIAVLILLIAALSGKGGSANKVSGNAVYRAGNYFVNAKGDSKEIDDISSFYSNANYSLSVYTNEDDDLYLIDSKFKTTKIASDVSRVYVGDTGKYVAYLTDEEDSSKEMTLYVYNVGKKKSNKLDTDVYGSVVAISASGEYVAYGKDYSDGEYDTYVAGFSSKAKKIGEEDCRPIAVSNNGKKAYYLNSDSNLYYYNGKEGNKVSTDCSGSFWVNSDLSEIVFNKNGKGYFYKSGSKDEVKITKDSISEFLTPDYISQVYVSEYARLLPFDTAKGQVVYTGGDLYWIDNKASDSVKIDSSVGSVHISADGKAIVYVSHDKVYKVTKFGKNMDPQPLYDEEDISYINASSDLKDLYAYAYDDNTVYYIKGKNKAEKISEDVYSWMVNPSDGKFYWMEDEELFSANKKASTKKKVEGIEGDVSEISFTPFGVGVYTYDDGEYSYYLITKKVNEVYSGE